MNLAATIELTFGGQGSGCQGPNCGRKAIGMLSEAKTFSSGQGQYRDFYYRDGRGRKIGNATVKVNGKTAQMNGVKIEEQFRGQGHASGLYESLFDALKKEGYQKVQSARDNLILRDEIHHIWKSQQGVSKVGDRYEKAL